MNKKERIEQLKRIIRSKNKSGVILHEKSKLATVNLDVITEAIYESEAKLFGDKETVVDLDTISNELLMAEVKKRLK